VDAILTAAAEADALVCMTTRGRGVVRATLLGSVAEAVVRSSEAPVLFVGPKVAADWHLDDDPLILAGLDGSRASVSAARAAGDLAGSIHARVRAVVVLRPTDAAPVGEYQGDLAMLEQVTDEVGRHCVQADHRIVDGFDPADTLAALAASDRVAAISVASHGRSGLARVVLGSVAMQTIRRAPCPVLVTGPGVRRHARDGADVSVERSSG
jgi:nucleotide-binding universal stress UspA family protein